MPLDLALAATGAASGGNFSFRKTRSSVIDLPNGSLKEHLGLDPTNTEHCIWQARNKAEEDLAAASAQAWVRAAEARWRTARSRHGRRCRRAWGRRKWSSCRRRRRGSTRTTGRR